MLTAKDKRGVTTENWQATPRRHDANDRTGSTSADTSLYVGGVSRLLDWRLDGPIGNWLLVPQKRQVNQSDSENPSRKSAALAMVVAASSA
ncbi:hypothetical protein INR49_017357 [Caranx melampygus]|nr:hypothetical protein INR49_017357 [Caranx melampygus]